MALISDIIANAAKSAVTNMRPECADAIARPSRKAPT